MMTTRMTLKLAFAAAALYAVPGWAQSAYLAKPAQTLLQRTPAALCQKATVSVPVGLTTHALLHNPAFQTFRIQPRLERKIFQQVLHKGYFPGYYRPSRNVNTQTLAYLRSARQALEALYPQTKRRFAPIATDSFQALVHAWKNGPQTHFMDLQNAVALTVERTAQRKPGFYAVAVESTPQSKRAVHDVLILDVNNARWISLRKSLAKARSLRTGPAANTGN